MRRLVLLVALSAATTVGAAIDATAGTRPPIAGRDVRTGRVVALSDHTGTPVFVNFWGSWCGGCKAEARTLAVFAKAHRRQVSFIGVDTIDSRVGAKAFYERYGIDYPSIWDPRGVIAGSWTRGTPTTLVFDRKHRLVTKIEGPATAAQLDAALKRASSRS